ncbi:phosphatase PAP2 family protein [Streptomyces sp. NBC_00237]|uniref:phosphatase PAP2 family protein n=1 Tax=Streptomyces sp. NBC_00237 TaxID=2975687 RepID=UPI002258312B|nr:phosphatase PAP2 family protein [Streptomyces sp. NBC_00237]MCX5207248.1 phosphatase PAP2 family protein [Streptomyces sp. NBC_00237]
MAGLSMDGSNLDVSLLYDINGIAVDAPGWADRIMEYVGEYGIMLGLVLVALWCWWRGRSRGSAEDAVASAAAIVWAPLAAGIAVLVNIPIRGFVERPRPFVEHKGLEVLVDGKTDFSFVSDHSTMAMAIAIGVFMANRKLGLLSIALAFAEGFCRVYMGVHYPTDVVGGFALGTAVALLLAPLALMVLTPVAGIVSRWGATSSLVRSRAARQEDAERRAAALAGQARAAADARRRDEGGGFNGLAA